MSWVAAFPMYDFPALEAVHDQLWAALSRHLIEAGVQGSPTRLSRHMGHEEVWGHPLLLLGQGCEYPLSKRYAQRIRLVATPHYRVPGCEGASYRSAILVRKGDPAKSLGDLRGRRCVINDWTSNSGMNLLRASVAPIAQGAPFFESVKESGSHQLSIDAVSGGQADVAAVDCVTLAYLHRLDPRSVAPLRVLDWTPATPSLPFITSATASDAAVSRLRSALAALAADAGMNAFRELLFLEGFDLHPTEGFGEVLRLERAASERGYPDLR